MDSQDPDEISRPYRRRFYLLLLSVIFYTYLQLAQDSLEFTERFVKPNNKGPVVVITGSTSGIGFELARRLLGDGFDVIGTYRNDKDRALLESNGIRPLYMEMRDAVSIEQAEKQVRAYVTQGKKEFLGVISNAGVLNAGPVERVDANLLEETIDVHLRGTVLFTKRFLSLVTQHKGGRIVIIGSLSAVLLPPANAAYNAAKAGQHAFALTLRQELSNLDVSVSLIVCGEIPGTRLHEKQKKKIVDWSNGYEVFQKTFEMGSKWMGESFMGTTFDDLHFIVRHALLDKHAKAVYYAPPFLEYLTFFTPRILIQKMMNTLPPDFIMSLS